MHSWVIGLYPVSSRKELISLSEILIFVTASRGYLDVFWLWNESHRTVREKDFLNSYHPQGTTRGNRSRSLVFCEGGL